MGKFFKISFLCIENTNDSEKSNHSALKTLSPDSHRLSKRLRKN